MTIYVCKFAIPIQVSILEGGEKIGSKGKGRVFETAVALREKERASFFSFSVGPANSTDHTGVNPRFEYA